VPGRRADPGLRPRRQYSRLALVEDHADALTLVLEKGRVGETYNIGGEAERRNIDVVHAIRDVMERLAPRNSGQPYRALVTFVPTAPGTTSATLSTARK